MKTYLITSIAALGLLAAPVYAATAPAKAPAAKTKVAKVAKHANKKPVAAATTKAN